MNKEITTLQKFKLKQAENLSIKLVHQLKKNESRRIDVYISLPKEMEVNQKTLPETEYFNTAIKGRRIYFTEGLELPLLHSRFVSRMQRSPTEYKTNLNLFAYQYIAALEIDTNRALKIDDSVDLNDFYVTATELTDQCLTVLNKFRASAPNNKNFISIYENVDNYISWKTEQAILRMISKKTRSNAFAEQRIAILNICSTENKYRLDKGYNSSITLNEPNRIANKMRLLRRIIEYNVIFKNETHELGKILKKVVTGVATALIMCVVIVLIIKTHGAFNNLNTFMILILALIYGVREVFKDDLKVILWHWIRKGKPKWARIFIDTTTQKKIGTQRIWLDYISSKKIPKQVRQLLSRRHSQNKQSAEFLHYRCETKVGNQDFQTGYDRIEETILFSLRPFARYLERGSDKLYENSMVSTNKQKIQRTNIERRYQINVVVAFDQGYPTQQFSRYRIVLNRSMIIGITKSESVKEKKKPNRPYSKYSKLARLLRLKIKKR